MLRALALVFVAIACSNHQTETAPEKKPTDIQDTIPTAPSKKCEWKETKRFKINTKGIVENSGMTYIDGKLYVINDSGNSSKVFSSSDFVNFDSYKIPFDNRDWEALASFNHKIYIADIGDNSADRATFDIIECDQAFSKCASSHFKYPKNKSPNAESFMINPKSGVGYVVMKDYDKHDPDIYRVNLVSKTVELIGVYKFDLVPGHLTNGFADASFSPSGDKFLITEMSGDEHTRVVECTFDLDQVKTQGELDESVKSCHVFKVDNLGQVESISYITENKMVYSSEGSSAPIVEVSCL